MKNKDLLNKTIANVWHTFCLQILILLFITSNNIFIVTVNLIIVLLILLQHKKFFIRAYTKNGNATKENRYLYHTVTSAILLCHEYFIFYLAISTLSYYFTITIHWIFYPLFLYLLFLRLEVLFYELKGHFIGLGVLKYD